MNAFADKGLSALEDAANGCGHAAKHFKGFATGMTTSSEALTER